MDVPDGGAALGSHKSFARLRSYSESLSELGGKADEIFSDGSFQLGEYDPKRISEKTECRLEIPEVLQ